METGDVMYEKVFMSPRPPPKISLKHEWKRELGSEHAQRSEVGLITCEEAGFVSRVHLLSGEVRSVTNALKVVEEVQEEVQEI